MDSLNIRSKLVDYHVEFRDAAVSRDAVVDAMRHDKKRSGAGLAVVMPCDDWSLLLFTDVIEAEALRALDELPAVLDAARPAPKQSA